MCTFITIDLNIHVCGSDGKGFFVQTLRVTYNQSQVMLFQKLMKEETFRDSQPSHLDISSAFFCDRNAEPFTMITCLWGTSLTHGTCLLGRSLYECSTVLKVFFFCHILFVFYRVQWVTKEHDSTRVVSTVLLGYFNRIVLRWLLFLAISHRMCPLIYVFSELRRFSFQRLAAMCV